MTKEHVYSTEQEKFWAGEFGNEYITRNEGDALLACNLPGNDTYRLWVCLSPRPRFSAR